MSNHPKRKINLVATIVISLIIIIVCALVFLLTYQKETTDKSILKTASQTSLICNANNPAAPFFSDDKAVNSSHDLRLTFRNDAISELYYAYKADFTTNDLATAASGSLHAKYNIYLSEKGVDAEKYSPTFSVIDNNLQITIYATQSSFNSAVAKLFFIDSEYVNSANNLSPEAYAEIFTAQNFQCNLNKGEK